MFLFDFESLEVVGKIQYTQDDIDGLSNNTVQSLLKNSENQIFVGTANNLNLLDFESPYFKNISKNKQGSHLLNDNVIFSILRDEIIFNKSIENFINNLDKMTYLYDFFVKVYCFVKKKY